MLTAETFRRCHERPSLKGVEVLILWADYCGSCNWWNAHEFPKLKTRYTDIASCSVDVMRHPEVAREFAVTRLPHFVILTEGRVYWESHSGFPDADTIADLAVQADAASKRGTDQALTSLNCAESHV